jgi:hypothetical protein
MLGALMFLFAMLVFRICWARPRSLGELAACFAGRLTGNAVDELRDEKRSILTIAHSVFWMVVQRIRDRDPETLLDLIDFMWLLLLPVLTVVTVRYTDTKSTPFFCAIWFPAGIIYGIALTKPWRAAFMAVFVEIIAGSLIPGATWYTWVLPSFIGPFAVAIFARLWPINLAMPSISDRCAIAVTFLGAALITAIVGTWCRFLFGELVTGTYWHESGTILSLRWFISDSISAQLLGPLVFELRRHLMLRSASF